MPGIAQNGHPWGIHGVVRGGRPRPSARFPKFVIHGGLLGHELRKRTGTSKNLILVPLIDLKFLDEIAAGGAGTSNRRHFKDSSKSSSTPAPRTASSAVMVSLGERPTATLPHRPHSPPLSRDQ